MVEFAHDFDFIFQGEFSLVACVLFLFRKGFDCDHLMISKSFCEVDSGEGALTDFLFGFEEFVEVALIDFLLELETPCFDCGWVGVEGELFVTVFSLKFEGEGEPKEFLVLGGLVEDLELELEL